MSQIFQLSGSYGSKPAFGLPSGQAEVDASIDEKLSLARVQPTMPVAATGAGTQVPFGALSDAHVVIVRAVGGPVKAEITSALGTTQILEVDPLLIVMARTNPVTALKLTSELATDVDCFVYLGEQAS